jgi:polyhydroxybutyrate depolymerase
LKSPLLAFIAILVSVLACGSNVPGIPAPLALPVGVSTRTLNYDGLERSYILYVPPGYDGAHPMAVVFVIHGGGGNAENAARMTAFNTQADHSGFLVVYPNGTGRLGDLLLTWNGGTCCGYAQEHNVDDVGFVRAILADLQSITAIDSKRIYATGMSNGGIMSYRLACEASDLIAAIAPVAGTLNYEPCQPSQPLSVIHFHGTNDTHLPYDGGVGSESRVGVEFASVQESVEFWTAFNGCNSQPQTTSFDDIQHRVWSGCRGGTSVELYIILGGKHAWPGSGGPAWAGGDEPTQSISASQLIWEFFALHPKP